MVAAVTNTGIYWLFCAVKGSLAGSSLLTQQGSDVRHTEQDPNREQRQQQLEAEDPGLVVNVTFLTSIFIRGELKCADIKNSRSRKYTLKAFHRAQYCRSMTTVAF